MITICLPLAKNEDYIKVKQYLQKIVKYRIDDIHIIIVAKDIESYEYARIDLSEYFIVWEDQPRFHITVVTDQQSAAELLKNS